MPPRIIAGLVTGVAVATALAWAGLLTPALAATAVGISAWTVAAAWGAATPPVTLPPNGDAAPAQPVEPDRASAHRIAGVAREVRLLGRVPGVDPAQVDHLGSTADVRAAGATRAVAALERAVGR
ncbi:MAG: hypothetical protein ACRCY9_20415 [Phycicoccus sp.]